MGRWRGRRVVLVARSSPGPGPGWTLPVPRQGQHVGSCLGEGNGAEPTPGLPTPRALNDTAVTLSCNHPHTPTRTLMRKPRWCAFHLATSTKSATRRLCDGAAKLLKRERVRSLESCTNRDVNRGCPGAAMVSGIRVEAVGREQPEVGDAAGSYGRGRFTWKSKGPNTQVPHEHSWARRSTLSECALKL